ncbi:hypothetical protein PTW35_10100 [Photobacterium sp. DA100]|uniref:peptidoglycan-binding protein n=1 Tax=Photobacterium sp. DA100 TaxID=3027472 RepID=UPI00247A2AC3|nr:peptidoglycan-binding protein [Photobacterium sp. DA100]WEM40996.1 hypothetical protein PTW35_10100 [Photobacterium sp. DA100]
MSLKPCRECDHPVSTEAKTCPNCGVKDPVLKFSDIVIGLAVLGAIVYYGGGFLLGLLFDSDKSHEEATVSYATEERVQIVRNFQREQGLSVDGIIGNQTCNATRNHSDIQGINYILDECQKRQSSAGTAPPAQTRNVHKVDVLDVAFYPHWAGHESEIIAWVNATAPQGCELGQYDIGQTDNLLWLSCDGVSYRQFFDKVVKGDTGQIQALSSDAAWLDCRERLTQHVTSRGWSRPRYSVLNNATLEQSTHRADSITVQVGGRTTNAINREVVALGFCTYEGTQLVDFTVREE